MERPEQARALFTATTIVLTTVIALGGQAAQPPAGIRATIPSSVVTAAEKIAKGLACKSVTSSPSIAKLSVSGVGLRTHTGVAIRMFKALADAGINIDLINTSEVRVNVIVDGKQGEKAAAQLEAAFADVMR